MRLRVTGGSPVELAGFVEIKSGATWNVIGTALLGHGGQPHR
jgi:hypothetical protein